MYYALTINADQIITGVHESVTPILTDTFSANPELADDTVVTIPAPADYQTYTHILCYDEDGTRKPDLWCIENGYMELPPNKEIINGELVDIMLPPEQQPITIAEFISAEIAAIKDEQSRVVTELQRDQNLALDLIRTNEETTIAQVREEQKQAVAAVKDEQIQAVEAVKVEHAQKINNMKPLMTELVKGKPADIVIQTADFILPWKEGDYKLDDVRLWEGQPRRCCQPHDSTGNPTWTPTMASLWAPYHGTTLETALPWIAPTGAQDMYKEGEWMVWTDGKTYECLSNTNYSPDDYAQAWREYVTEGAPADGGAPDPIEPEPETNSNGTAVWSEWKAWTSGLNKDLYQEGDRVTHNEVRYIATAGNNHYEPGVYGWEVVTE